MAETVKALFVCVFLLQQSVNGAVSGPGPLLGFVAVNVLQCLQLFDQGLVLVFQHGHAVLQTLDVLLLFPAALSGRLPGEEG